jgi:sigma-E factor negative regulatory protein RseC
VVAVAETDLLKAGALAYMLPIVLAIAGAVLATLWGYGDGISVLAMLSGIAIGLLAARRLGGAPRLMARPSTSTRSDSTSQGDAP